MRRLASSVLLVLAFVAPVRGERLAIKTYTTADGLGSSAILNIDSDSQGFLWFSTRNGLSRFDGLEFRTYTTDDGLPNPVVNDLLQTSGGEYWVAMNGGGVCRLNVEANGPPTGSAQAESTTRSKPPLFTCRRVGDTFLSNRVNTLLEDRRRRIWVGTDDGLFRMERKGDEWRLEPVRPEGLSSRVVTVRALYEDEAGRLWITVFKDGLLRIDPDDNAVLYQVHGIDQHDVRAVAGRDGVIWVGLRVGLLGLRPARRLVPSKRVRRVVLKPSRACFGFTGAARSFLPAEDDTCLSSARDGLPTTTVVALLRDSSSNLWIATTGGLALLDYARFSSLADTEGLAQFAGSLGQDRDGHLWIGTLAGAIRLTLDGMVSYDQSDGLAHPRVYHLLELDDALFAVSYEWALSRFDGVRFRPTRPRIPRDATFTYANQGAFLDRSGRWWLLTDRGLLGLRRGSNLDDVARRPPETVLTKTQGLPDNNVVRVFEDSRGDLWIATRSPSASNLSRWERATGKVHAFRDGFGAEHQFPMAFAEDRQGAVWIGFVGGGLARFNAGRFATFGAAHGVPLGVTALLVDAGGRLWIASSSAGARVVHEVADRTPRFESYTTARGLSSNNVQCLADDRWGRIYLGTSRGVDRLDPSTGRVRRFTTAEGLASDYVTAALRDRSGTLWFGTNEGISRLVARPDAAASPPPIWIGELRAGGEVQPVSVLGATSIGNLTLAPDRNHLQITFFGVGFGAGHPLRYRYRLDGAEPDWTGPTERRVVHYASLAPGRYRFVVEALNGDSVVSRQPATVSFTVLAPIWRRWWFVTLAMAIVAAAMYAVYRYRVARLLELERIRTRIASDLHDDIGANLSQIAIMSEVARQQAPSGSALVEPLSAIATSSRESLDAMSDIVWAVNPKRDSLADLAHRMRRFASDVLSAKDVRITFSAPGVNHHLVVDAHVRRDVLLIFKESINNIARHSGCREARIAIAHEDDAIILTIEDDGRGFGSNTNSGGLGLESMRRRAEKLGGALTVASAPDRGTRLTLRVPIGGSRRFRRLSLLAWVVTPPPSQD